MEQDARQPISKKIMQTEATFILGDWEITVSNCRFTCSSLTCGPLYRSSGDYTRLRIPFSLDRLIRDHAIFGLVPNIEDLLTHGSCVAVVADANATGGNARRIVAPGVINNFSEPIGIWVRGPPPQTRKEAIKFCIFFVSPLPPREMTTYVFKGGDLPPGAEEPETLHSAEAPLPSRETLVTGQLRSTSPRTYTGYFHSPVPLSFLDLLTFESMGCDNVEGDPEPLTPKYLTFTQTGERLYKVTVHNTHSTACKKAHIRFVYRPTPSARQLVMGQASPLITTPLGARVFAVYPDCEKTIPPQETTTLRIQLLFEQHGANAGECAFVIMGLARETKFVSFPAVLLPGKHEHLTVFNPQTHPLTIQRDTIVGVAMACYIHPGKAASQAPYSFYDCKEESWHVGLFQIKHGPGGVCTPPCHVAIRADRHEEPMQS